MEFAYQNPLLNPLVSVLIASLIFVCCLLQCKHKAKNTKEKQQLLPPMPSNSWPIIGHLHLLKGLPHIALGKLADQYGPIFMLRLGVRRALVVSSAEVAKECLVGVNDKVFLNRPHKIFVEHMAYNSSMFGFSPYGQYWREIRKIVTVELLSNQRVEMLEGLRTSVVRSAISKISSLGSKPIDMRHWFSDINMSIIVRLVSGKAMEEVFQSEEYDKCSEALRDFFELATANVIGDFLPALRWFDIGGHEKRMKKAAKEIDHVAQRWLDERNSGRNSNDNNQQKRGLIDVLLSIFDAGEEGHSYNVQIDTIVKANCMNMILAGADTTSVTLSWALSLLLNNKDVLKKTQAELETVVGNERLVDESDLKNLVYLQAILKECMRLYPAGPLSVPRESTVDCTVSGYHIPAGTQLFVNLYKIHRDPTVWKDPLTFDPERFLTICDKGYDFRGTNLEYMPFGSGRRICPGISFAQPALELILASLLHGFEFSTASGETVDMTEGFGLSSMKATPLEVILTRRLPSHLYNDTTTPVIN